MSAFPAQYSGRCLPCGLDIHKGDSIVGHPDAGFIHEDCAEDVTMDHTTRGRPSGITVLPRGKTGKDKCVQCFIVHAPGQEGCE